MNYAEESLKKHYEWNGKIEVISRCPVETREDMALAYTPGVAEACLVIKNDVNKSFELTRRNNLVAVVTDGTAVVEVDGDTYTITIESSVVNATYTGPLSAPAAN